MFKVERSITPDLFESIMSNPRRQRGGDPVPSAPKLEELTEVQELAPTPAPAPSRAPRRAAPPPPTPASTSEAAAQLQALDKEVFSTESAPVDMDFPDQEGGKMDMVTLFKLDWDGFSGLLQWFTKYPIPIEASWAPTLNQILWNIIFFILFYGLIYGAIINSGSEMISVPEEIQQQTPSPWTQGIYFSIVTMTSLGFGDITPGTFGGQMIVTSQILLFFMFNFIWTLNFDVSSS